MLRILVADDHPVVRQGIKQILTEMQEVVEVGEAGSAQQTLEMALKQDWDVVVLDISMPDRNGLEVLKELQRIRPKLPVLILSYHPEDQLAVRILKDGAAGYLTKESAPDELIKAIRKAVAGGKYVGSTLAEILASQLATASGPIHQALSDREYQVLIGIVKGKSLKEIASELMLSVKTISTYRARLLEKMHMASNAELVAYAIRNRLIE